MNPFYVERISVKAIEVVRGCFSVLVWFEIDGRSTGS